MNPAAAALAIQVIQMAIQNEPAIAAEIAALFSQGIPTPAQFATAIANIQAETYRQFVPKSDLPDSIQG
jgi:hypothetical protein